jgi:hypothetical protein
VLTALPAPELSESSGSLAEECEPVSRISRHAAFFLRNTPAPLDRERYGMLHSFPLPADSTRRQPDCGHREAVAPDPPVVPLPDVCRHLLSERGHDTPPCWQIGQSGAAVRTGSTTLRRWRCRFRSTHGKSRRSGEANRNRANDFRVSVWLWERITPNSRGYPPSEQQPPDVFDMSCAWHEMQSSGDIWSASGISRDQGFFKQASLVTMVANTT